MMATTKAAAMLDWLLRAPGDLPMLDLGGRQLPVVVRRLANARRMTMRLAPDGSEVRIAIPRWGRTAEALAFAEARRDWLERQFSALPQPCAIGHGSQVPWRGAMLVIDHDPARPRKVAAGDGTLVLGGPAESLESRLRRWMQKEATPLIAADLAHYCAKAGKPAPPLSLSSAQRRWGSCAGDGTIRINWRLIMAPDFVRRSVVAHEAAHLVHFDHSPRFHALLGDIYEHDIRTADLWLKREGRGLYRWLG